MDCKVHMANVDSEFKRCSGDQDFDFAILELVFRFEAEFAGQASVVSGDAIFTQTVSQVEGNTLSQSASVNEDQCGPVFLHESGDAVVSLIPEFIAGDGTKFLSGDFNGEIERTFMSDIDHDRVGLDSSEEVGDRFNGLLGGREANSNRGRSGKRVESLQRQHEMSAALVIGYGVDFIYDYGFYVAQDFTASLSCEENVE